MEKPRYSASKRMIYGSLVAAWGLVYLLAYGAIFRPQTETSVAFTSFASLVIPLTFALIVALLGVHRGFGSLDMRTQLKHGPLARDQPALPSPEAATDGGQT
ncbi:hypothetical protein [Rhizobium sp. C1]|uniref:hypothetical protein n=1 Tax=Rhizobium sp. C1 TaxID=1349799 RepID=UPI001E371477|nr:hypothetical protein [Rhizobium sp. C1]MCD2176462.1 hypothetical protein [Rhizobium sp. C1]